MGRMKNDYFIFNPLDRAKSDVGANFPQQKHLPCVHIKMCTKLMYYIYIVYYVTTFFDAVKP